jgi:hypothetical protein
MTGGGPAPKKPTSSVEKIVTMMQDIYTVESFPKTSLTVEEKVMIALRFFASGSHLQVIGDTMGHDKFIISRVDFLPAYDVPDV